MENLICKNIDEAFTDFYEQTGYSEKELYKYSEWKEDLLEFEGESEFIKKFNLKKSDINIITKAITQSAAHHRSSQKSMMATKANTIVPPDNNFKENFKDTESLIQTRQNHMREVAEISKLISEGLGLNGDFAYLTGLLHDIGKSIDHETEGSHVQIGADLCRKYKESELIVNAVEAHHGDIEPQSLIACIVQAADAISAARPGARRETIETYTNRLKQLEDITNEFKGVDKSFAIQAGREIRIMVVPELISDADMVLLARDISKKIEEELAYPGQIKVNVIRESRVTDYAK